MEYDIYYSVSLDRTVRVRVNRNDEILDVCKKISNDWPGLRGIRFWSEMLWKRSFGVLNFIFVFLFAIYFCCCMSFRFSLVHEVIPVRFYFVQDFKWYLKYYEINSNRNLITQNIFDILMKKVEIFVHLILLLFVFSTEVNNDIFEVFKALQHSSLWSSTSSCSLIFEK